MSYYVTVFAGRNPIFSWQNGLDIDVFALFAKDEHFSVEGSDGLPYAVNWDISDMSEEEINGLKLQLAGSTAGEIKDRLDVLGIGHQLAVNAYDELVRGEIARLEEYVKNRNFKELRGKLAKEIKILRESSWESLLEAIRESVETGHELQPEEDGSTTAYAPVAGHGRLMMRAVTEALSPGSDVKLDLSEIELIKLDDEHPEYWAADEILNRANTPPIIITEGTFDVQVLQGAIKLLYPHILPYLKFMDFELRPEGGAAAAVRTIKSLAAAGVSNRVVAILDNDTAARDAARALHTVKLPDHFRVIHYPNIELGTMYPTIGAQGSLDMNVNGLAGSIELYLGEDVLRDPNGILQPVRWSGFIEGLSQYQGVLSGKSDIQARYRAKLKSALKDKKLVSAHDWSGIHSIVQSLLGELSQL